MLSWIPLLGPILQGLFSTVTSIVNSFNNLQISKVQAEVTSEQTAAQIIHDTNDDIGLRILRDAALLGPVVWSALIGWDTVVSARWPWLMFHVNPYPDTVGYLPYAALVFLFGNIGFNIWKRK